MSNTKYITAGKKYSKRNFSEVVELLVPQLYLEDDIIAFGKAYDLLDVVIEAHLNIANNIGSILDIDDGNLFTNVATFEGIAPFFVKQNNYLEKSPYDFYRDILLKDGVSLNDFDSSAQFKDYVDLTLLPKIQTNSPTLASHDELIQSLNWFYFLASGTSDSVEPSSIVSDYLVSNIFAGGGFTLADGINCLTEYLWRNANLRTLYIPEQFHPGQDLYTSGTQQLEKLKTINNILYSNEYFDKFDTRIYEAFEEYQALGYYNKELLSNGPFWRLLKAYSFAFADIQNETDKIKTLYDLQDCPDQLLPELAYLIGWDLLGSDPNKWRVQLYNAVDIYKKTGTKQSIQAVVNAVFTEGVVSIDSQITELWESYIPFLIMYALSTESYLFKDYSTWTRGVSNNLGVDKYDINNFETNIRLAVDTILLNLFNQYPTLFKLGGKPFPRNSNRFLFNYRGRDFPIPPFEEIPYYMTCELTTDFINSIVSELVCFGVNVSFATQVGDYIFNNTIKSNQSIQEENSWLMFTLNNNLPPNFNSLLSILGDHTEKYITLWNGKSSHYQLNFVASNFDFTKVTYEADSKQVILIAAKAARRFSPAHSIANFKVTADDSDSYGNSPEGPTDQIFNYLLCDMVGSLSEGADSETITNYEQSGVDFLGTELEFNSLGRNRYDSLSLSAYTEGDATIAGRNTFRRRNYRSALDINSYYDRSGFNQPLFLDSGIPNFGKDSDNGLFLAGFIPTSLNYFSSLVETDCSSLLSSIHPSLDRCNYTSDSEYFGYNSSATLKCRGYGSLDDVLSGNSNPTDRGQLDPFMYLIYQIETRKILLEAQKEVEDNEELYRDQLIWKNVSGSIANSMLSCGNLLSSLDDYRNYAFGQKIHRLFNLYTSTFNYHSTQKYSGDLNKSNILVHCFGNILKNGDFRGVGSKGSEYNLFASSLDSVVRLTPTSPFFSGTEQELTGYNSVILTDASSLVADSPGEFTPTIEIVNSSIASFVDVVHTSGTSRFNEFTFYNLQTPRDSYSFNNPLVKLKSINGLPRLKFRITGSPMNESLGSYREHFLHPDHNFKLTIKGLAALDDGSILTNTSLGVWIHTESENTNHSWHFNKEGVWELIDVNDITKDLILEQLTHVVRFDNPDISASSTIILCQEEITTQVDRAVPQLIEGYYSTKELYFNTLNKCNNIRVPADYYQYNQQVHRLDQSYVIEVFMIPSEDNFNKFILLDDVSMRDETLWDHTRLELDPLLLHTMTDRLCSNKKLDLHPDDIRTILQFYNTIAGKSLTEGPLGRDATKSSYVNSTSGGSRLSYRFNPEWYQVQTNTDTDQITQITLD